MSNFTPQGNIYIGAVPFDSSYKNVIWFDSIQAQQDYFLNGLTSVIYDGTYKYIRANNYIQIAGSAEQYQVYNYVAYRNTNYGNKWYYAFIENVEYVNENTTRLYISLDVFQTWLFNWDHSQVCYIDREHASDDTIGANLTPEPSFELEYGSLHLETYTYSLDYACIQTTTYPYFKTTGRSQLFTVPISTPDIFGVASGAAILFFDMRIDAQKTKFYSLLEDYTAAGIADSIINIFMLPSAGNIAQHLQPLVIDVNGESVTVPDLSIFRTSPYVNPPSQNIQAQRYNTHLDNYIPRNNKLLTYPYTFLRIGDYSGRVTEFKYEYSGHNGYIYLRNKFAPTPDSTGYVMPYIYNGNSGECTEEIFTYNNSVTGSWTGSEYATWRMMEKDIAIKEMNYNSAYDNYKINESIRKAALGLLATGITRNPLPGLTGIGIASAEIMTQFWDNEKKRQGFDDALHNLQMNETQYSRIPNHANGNMSGNSRAAYGYLGFYCNQIALHAHCAKMIDDFFSIFGYSVQSVKVPNWHSRANWNYVKTIGANFQSTAPNSDQLIINSIFDNGVTLWHHGAVGNYNKDGYLINPIV